MAALNNGRLMEENSVKQLERSNPIVEVAVELGLKLNANMGKCFYPQRHGADPSPTLFFNVAKNTFFCKTCTDVGGGVIDLVRQVKGWDRQQAIDWLAHRNEFDQLTKKRYHGKGKKK
jgi:hypothetical protein